MTDTLYDRFVQRWEEVTDLPTQTVGPLTPLYKFFVSHLKSMPLPWLIAVSILVVGLVFFLTRLTLTGVTSFLQKGF